MSVQEIADKIGELTLSQASELKKILEVAIRAASLEEIKVLLSKPFDSAC